VRRLGLLVLVGAFGLVGGGVVLEQETLAGTASFFVGFLLFLVIGMMG
jgi:hypothetical protein